MSFIEGEGTLINANMKKGGKMILQVEVTGDFESKEDYFHLRKMIERKIRFSLDSQVVSYNVQINARTEKPLRTYRVDEQGVVSEVQPQGEQLEMDLGVAKKSDPIADVPEEIGREVVDEFILSGLAPQPKGFYPLAAWIGRIADGDTYLKIAGEEGIASGRVVDLIDEYRQSVAPLAAKWDEWRKAKGEQPDLEENDDSDADDEPAESVDEESGQGEQEQGRPADPDDDIEMEDVGEQQEAGSSEDDLSDWEQSIMQEGKAADSSPEEPVDVETIILTEKPSFEDIPFDFPTLLERKKLGETWMDIANSLGTRSTVLSAAWTKYKKRVAESRGGAA